MPILPIDSGRYGSAEMRKIFDEENRLQRMLDVEAALALTHARLGNIPPSAARAIASKASTRFVHLDEVKAIDRKIKHDTMAMVKALANACGQSGGYVHYGATSYDVVDSANALVIRDALEIIERQLVRLESLLMRLARKHANRIMIGRTHGQHSVPITLGLKFAVWLRECSRHIERLCECRKRVLVGKMSGAVGTMAGLGDHAFQIQREVMRRLGLACPEVTTQIVQRDRHAELVCLLANIASSLDKFATEIRNLQRPEIDELAEPFDIGEQVGSSTMPHKMNPRLCENTCSLAKIVRSLAIPALEAVVTWHERDLTQSASERFVLPEAFILLDQMLMNTIEVLEGLQVNKKRMQQNLQAAGDFALSESVMMALAKKGMGRQVAHEHLRRLSINSLRSGKSLRDLLVSDETARKFLTSKEIDEALRPENYLGKTEELINLAIRKTIAQRVSRKPWKASELG